MEIRVLCIAAVAALGASGCGYRFGVLRHEGVESIHVPIFEYHGLEQRRGIEFEITRAVKEEILSRSGLALTGPAEADAILEGEIVQFRESVVLEDRRDNVLESSVAVTLNLRLRRKDGEVLVEKLRMQERAFVSVAGGADETQARREAFNDMAERIVFAMEGGW